MQSQYDVVGVGNAIVDVIASVPEGFLTTHNIRKGGMTLISQFEANELARAFGDIGRRVPGGSGANTIAGLVSFSGKAGYIGKTANDELGKFFRKEMERVGMSLFRHHPSIRKRALALHAA
jgi:sugar/nucleoside kinase (ribokinase family)